MDKQQIKARFFGQHIGCNLVALNFIARGKYALSGVSTTTSGGMVFFTEDGGSFTDNVTDCKLVLRPLSSITLDEVIGLMSIPGIDEGEGYSDKLDAAEYLLPMIRAKNGWNIQEETAISFEYYRSINICVPFMGFDPIAEGWAILDEEFSENAPQETPQEEKI